MTEGESVHLSTDLPKIERGDVIEWMFGDEIIAVVVSNEVKHLRYCT